nr:LysM peptidoglycan-binding domain-containing protein [Kofleriaceae bacterium]
MQVARGLGIAATLVFASGVAVAQPDAGDAINYRVRKGDTLELVAAEIYGDRADAVLIEAANKMQKPRPLQPGERLRVPRNRDYVTKPGDTIASIARDLLGDERRAPFLADMDKLVESPEPLTAGVELDIPLTVVHESAGNESIATVATTYYGDAKNAELLRTYNSLDHDLLDKGEKLTVPLPHVKVHGQKSTLDDDAQKRIDRQRAAAAAADIALPRARDAWAAGEFARVVEYLGQDIIDLDYLDASVAADVGVLLGKGYVAMGMVAQASTEFERVVRRKPDRVMRAFDESPKVRELWKRAGGKVED